MLKYMSIVFIAALSPRVQAIVLVNSMKIWQRKKQKDISWNDVEALHILPESFHTGSLNVLPTVS